MPAFPWDLRHQKEYSMDDMTKERTEGLDFEYLAAAVNERKELGDRFLIPVGEHLGNTLAFLSRVVIEQMGGKEGSEFVFKLTGHIFGITAKALIEKLGEEKAEALLKEIVETFGEERGKRIAERVKAQGKPLTFKNFLIHTDMDSSNVTPEIQPSIVDGKLVLDIPCCAFNQGAQDAGFGEYAYYYCKYIDRAIIRGYNPDIRLEVSHNLTKGDDHCRLIYDTMER